MKVGITIKTYNDENIWKNGLIQNCIFFYDLLERIDFIDSVYFLQVGFEDELNKTHAFSSFNLDFLNSQTLDRITKEYDLILSLGALPPESIINTYTSNPKNRFVQYKGGNEFINEIESILYGTYQGWPGVPLKRTKYVPPKIHEIWMVPQQEFHNKDYFEIKHKSSARVVPFVWSPKFIDSAAEVFMQKGKTPYFHEKKIDKWTVASFEPNMSVLKNMMPLIYGMEHAYNSYEYIKENLEGFMVTNSYGFHSVDSLVSLANDLNLKSDGKISFDGRYPIVFILSEYAHVVVSHQWGNALNYAYLDSCWFGIPTIHNAHLCKDLGFYYEEWKIKEIGRILNDIMQNLKQDQEFLNKQRAILKRYTIDNQDMIDQYALLIKNLWEKNDIDDKVYNPMTNLLE